MLYRARSGMNLDAMSFDNTEYSLLGYRGKKSGNSSIIYLPYVPRIASNEELDLLKKKRRAGWTYATVSLDHPSAYVRGKCGKVLETRASSNGIKEYCLLIDKTNYHFKNGCRTWIGVPESAYKKEWVEENFIIKLESYGRDGEIVPCRKLCIENGILCIKDG